MQVRKITTENPACCGPETSLKGTASMMADWDCGEIPGVDDDGHPIGVVTDRDMSCRGVAPGKAPRIPVREVMSNPVVTVTPKAGLSDYCKKLEEIRRAPVVDEGGACLGMVSQVDIAQHAPEHEAAREVSSQPRRPLASAAELSLAVRRPIGCSSV
jgi:CBS domain-containing protein